MTTRILEAQTPAKDQRATPRDHTAVNWAGDPADLTDDQLRTRLSALATAATAMQRPYAPDINPAPAPSEVARVLDLWAGCREVLLERVAGR